MEEALRRREASLVMVDARGTLKRRETIESALTFVVQHLVGQEANLQSVKIEDWEYAQRMEHLSSVRTGSEVRNVPDESFLQDKDRSQVTRSSATRAPNFNSVAQVRKN
eukprot:Pompholyxophrys_punicea_v1_NODE_126_length_3319_cov_18.116115.p4 type:complete len:109 gc:universal NODE_126_length_3319_cov_18.116115:1131-1457(+)